MRSCLSESCLTEAPSVMTLILRQRQLNGGEHITRMSTKGLALKLGWVNSSKIPVSLPKSIPFHSTTSVQ